MKNKKIIYFLVPAVILIWGLIIYKILQASDTTTKVFKSVATTMLDEKEVVEEDVYVLSLNYRDPFFGKAPSVTIARAKAKVENLAPVDVATRDIMAELKSKVQFHGIIDNTHQSNRIGLITYEGKKIIVRKNDTIDDIKILEVSGDFIQIAFESKKYNINKGIDLGTPVEQLGNNR